MVSGVVKYFEDNWSFGAKKSAGTQVSAKKASRTQVSAKKASRHMKMKWLPVKLNKVIDIVITLNSCHVSLVIKYI